MSMLAHGRNEVVGRYFQVAKNTILDSNKKIVNDFDKQKELRGVGISRRLRIIRWFSQLQKVFKKPLSELDRKDIEKYLLFLQKSDYAGDTKGLMWIFMKQFARQLKINIEDLKPIFKRTTLSASEILTQDEVEKIILYAETFSEKVLLSFLWESGCRIGELMNLKASDLQFDENGCIVSLEGKTGKRRIRLIGCVSELKRFQEINKIEDNVPLFPFCEASMREKIKIAARRADINKNIYPHLFRHSRATHLAKFLTEQELKYYMGWSGSSRMAGTYVHLSGADLDKKLLELNSKTKISVQQSQTVQQSVQQNVIVQPQANTINFVMPPEFMQFLGEMFLKWKEQQKVLTH